MAPVAVVDGSHGGANGLTAEQPADRAVNDEPLNIAITGFGPFFNIPVNPSWQCLLPLQAQGTFKTSRGRRMKLDTFEIPVVYEEVLERIAALHNATNGPSRTSTPDLQPSRRPYDLIVHIGVSPSRHYCSIETGARRYGYEQEDFAKKKARSAIDPATGELVSGFIDTEWAVDNDGWLKSHIDIAKLAARVTRTGVADIQVSDDAGLFLCEFTYFTSLAHAERSVQGTRNPAKPVVFVHVPMDDVFPVSQLTQIVYTIVAELVDSL